MKLLKLLAIIYFSFSSTVFAKETNFVKDKFASSLKLNSFDKWSLGPEDQYQATEIPNIHKIIWTQKNQMSPQLYVLNTLNNKVFKLFSVDYDSEQAVISSDSKLAFTYFRSSSKGDICYSNNIVTIQNTISDSEVICLKRFSGKDQSNANSDAELRSDPFFKTNNEIGYLARSLTDGESKIWIQNIFTQKRELITQGLVSSPSMVSNGKYLVYTKIRSIAGIQKKQIILYDFSTKSEIPLQLDIPGEASFASLSPDEKYIYFTVYSSDTNQDTLIDNQDHSAIYRVQLQILLNKSYGLEKIFPEQITSHEYSCSIANPIEDKIYFSCSFENSLDVYSLPLEGSIPQKWSDHDIRSAIESSRSYEQRSLLFNQLLSRSLASNQDFKSLYQVYLPEILMNHIYQKDYLSVLFDIDKLLTFANSESPEYFKNSIYLSLLREIVFLKQFELRNSQKNWTQKDLSDFKVILKDSHNLSSKIIQKNLKSKFSAIKSIIDAEYDYLLNQKKSFSQNLNLIKQNRIINGVEAYLYEFLIHAIANPEDYYKDLASKESLNEEYQVYFAYLWLNQMEIKIENLKDRLQYWQSIKQNVKNAVLKLIEAEIAILEIRLEKDIPGKQKKYALLDKVMSITRDQYLLRKSVYIRAIKQFADHENSEFLNYVASNWLRYTREQETEFVYARTVVAQTSLEQAYLDLQNSKLMFADNHFYQAMLLTDDIEAHFGYFNSMKQQAKDQQLEKTYENLLNRQMLTKHIYYIQALKMFDLKNYDKSIELLQKLISESESKDSDFSLVYLLMGSCYYQQIIQKQTKWDIPNELFLKTEEAFKKAYDLSLNQSQTFSQDRFRVRAAAAQNLGFLYLKVRNPASAEVFLAERLKYKFINTNDEYIQIRQYILSLVRQEKYKNASKFLSHFYKTNSIELTDLFLKSSDISPKEVKWLEASKVDIQLQASLFDLWAYSLMMNSEFQKAFDIYTLLQTSQSTLKIDQGALNKLKLKLNLAILSYKLKNYKQSAILFKELKPEMSSLKPDLLTNSKNELSISNLRLVLIYYGFYQQCLEKIMGTKQERIQLLTQRLELLKEISNHKKIANEDMNYETALEDQAQVLNQLAELEPDKDWIDQALQLVQLIYKDNKKLNIAIYRTITNYLYLKSSAKKIPKQDLDFINEFENFYKAQKQLSLELEERLTRIEELKKKASI